MDKGYKIKHSESIKNGGLKMKKILTVLFILIAVQAHAAGSWVKQSLVQLTPTTKILVFDCKGDGSTGAISDTTVNANIHSQIKGWYLLTVQTDPGTTAPTADSDVYIKDSVSAIDLLNAAGVDLLQASAAKSTYAQTTDSLPLAQMIINPLTLDVDNQAVSSALYKIILTIVK